MKKQIAVLFVCVVFLLSITACAAPEDKVVASLGEYEKKEFFTSGGFRIIPITQNIISPLPMLRGIRT